MVEHLDIGFLAKFSFLVELMSYVIVGHVVMYHYMIFILLLFS